MQIDIVYNSKVRSIRTNGHIYDVLRTDTGIYWGIFVDGKKVTEFMHCLGSDALKLVPAFLRKEYGINFYEMPISKPN